MKTPWILTTSPKTAVNLSMASVIWVAEPYTDAEPYRVNVSMRDGEEYILFAGTEERCIEFIRSLVSSEF